MNEKPYKGKKTNAELAAIGYRVVSRSHQIVARLDREDWKERLASDHVRGMDWVNQLGEGSAQDYYRRCLSKDRLIVDSIQGIPNSGFSVAEFNKVKP